MGEIRAREREGQIQMEEMTRKDGEGKSIGDVARRIWMGGETEGWRERRAREEQEALEQGLGYGDLIVKYVKDAWGVNNTGNKGEGKRDSKDEKET